MLASAMYQDDDDGELMQRYQRGEIAAFDVLYARHKAPLYRYCMRQVRNPEAAAELFQDIWARIIRGHKNYRPVARFSTWLYQVAHNTWVDQVRKAVRRPTLVAVDDSGTTYDQAAAPGANPSVHAQAGETMALIVAAVEALPADQREVFLLREETDLTLEEIGEITGVSRETAKSRLRYALKKLRSQLETSLPDAGPVSQTDGLAGEMP